MMRRVLAAILGIAILTVGIGLAGIPAALAQSQGSGIITFESGVDGQEIGSTLPGMSFSNAAGNPWLYGDVRTGQYNAAYPNDCPAFGGQCAYTVNGNMFAWMGAAQGTGRIDFTAGTVEYFSALFSTAETLTIEAYDSANKLLASQQIAPNQRTGRLDKAELYGSGLTYVLIKGTQNRWLMDDLTTNLPSPTKVVPTIYPTLPPTAEAVPEIYPAKIAVVQRSQSAATITPGSALTLTVVARNYGRGIAKDVVITMPLGPALLRVDEATFSRQGAWVSAISDTALTVQTGPLFTGDVVTATIRLAVRDTAAAEGAFGEPLSFTWADATGSGSGSGNNLGLRVGGPAFAPGLAGSASGSAITFSSAIFAPSEPVGLWYNTPDGKTVAVSTAFADASGAISVAFNSSGLAAGGYTMVAYGHWTEFTAMAPFTVSP